MAALSYYSTNNWAGSFTSSDSDIPISDPELQSLHDMWNVDDYPVDPTAAFLFPPPADDYCNSLLLDFSYNSTGITNNFDNNLNFLETQSFPPPPQELMEPPFHNHYYPKRQKLCDSDELYSSLFGPCLSMLQDYSPPPEFSMPPPELPDFAPPGFCMGSVKNEGGGGGGGNLSAQSVAARQRRRKITVKTQELGKLVPGGQKMNTAEMLQSAYKYIKFLQAQVSLLEFVGSRHQEVTEVSFEDQDEFQKLLESPLIQEKLYSTENCLVPQKLVEKLCFDDKNAKSNPHLLPNLEKDH